MRAMTRFLMVNFSAKYSNLESNIFVVKLVILSLQRLIFILTIVCINV